MQHTGHSSILCLRGVRVEFRHPRASRGGTYLTQHNSVPKRSSRGTPRTAWNPAKTQPHSPNSVSARSSRGIPRNARIPRRHREKPKFCEPSQQCPRPCRGVLNFAGKPRERQRLAETFELWRFHHVFTSYNLLEP